MKLGVRSERKKILYLIELLGDRKNKSIMTSSQKKEIGTKTVFFLLINFTCIKQFLIVFLFFFI